MARRAQTSLLLAAWLGCVTTRSEVRAQPIQQVATVRHGRSRDRPQGGSPRLGIVPGADRHQVGKLLGQVGCGDRTFSLGAGDDFFEIDASELQALLQFSPKPNIDPLRIIELVQKQRHIRLAGSDKLKIELKQGHQLQERIHAVRDVLRALH